MINSRNFWTKMFDSEELRFEEFWLNGVFSSLKLNPFHLFTTTSNFLDTDIFSFL